MTLYKHSSKFIAVILIVVFVFYSDAFLFSQELSEIQQQYQRAKKQYLDARYSDAKNRLERIIGIIGEKNLDHKKMMGECHLLLGGIWEKEGNEALAEENYRKAKGSYGVESVDGVPFKNLPIYNRIIRIGEDATSGPVTGGRILKEGKKKKKKFPWVLVVGGVVVLTVVGILVFKKKKKRTLSVTVGEGIDGTPGAGTYTYRKGETVTYSYSLRSGYTDIEVLLDGQRVAASGTIKMSENHALSVSASANQVNLVTDSVFIEIDEGSTGTFNVKLSAQPAGNVDVTVARLSGDTDITVLSGADLTFTPSNWSTYRTVVIQVAEDVDTVHGEATIQISAAGMDSKDVVVRERDNDALNFVTNTTVVDIVEGNTANFQVRLSSQPSDDVEVTVSVASGDTDISVVSGSELSFTRGNWNAFQTITLRAAEDQDTLNGEAIVRVSAPGIVYKELSVREVDNDVLAFVTDTDELLVTEGGTSVLQVKLSAIPEEAVEANVSWLSGDNDISVASGSSLIFNATNWDTYQSVIVNAAEDADAVNGTALIRISGVGVQIESKDVTVTEIDND